MVQVKFYGDLKRFVREPVELEVDSFSELMSGLLTQIKGLREHLKKVAIKLESGKTLILRKAKLKPTLTLSLIVLSILPRLLLGRGKALVLVK